MSGEGRSTGEEGEKITTMIPSRGQLHLRPFFDRVGLKQGDVVQVHISSGGLERDFMARVRSRGRISLPKSQLDKEALEKLPGNSADLWVKVVPPADSTELFNEGKIDLRGVVSRLGGYVARTDEGIKLGLEDGRGEIRTLTPHDSQMDLERFFENVGRNFADNDGAEGHKNMDPKMISEYIEYLEDMGVDDFYHRLQISSHRALSDRELEEYHRHRIKLNPELAKNTKVYNRIYPPVEKPTRNPIGTASVEKKSVPLRQIHEEAQKIVREAADGKFAPDLCRQICQSFVRGAWGGDGGINDNRGSLQITYSEHDPEKRALVRDAIEVGHGVRMNENPQRNELITSNQKDIKRLTKEGIAGSNAIRGGRLIGEQIQRAKGAEREEFEQLLRDHTPWLREYIKVVRELEQSLSDSVVPIWKKYVALLEDVLPPEDISLGFHQPPPGS